MVDYRGAKKGVEHSWVMHARVRACLWVAAIASLPLDN